MVHRERTILSAGLENLVVPSNGFDQDFAFVNRQRRFLALNVLARANRHDADERVPMIRRGDHNGIDVSAVEKLAKVLERCAIMIPVMLIHHLFGAAQMAAVNVAHGKNSGIGLFQIGPKIPTRAVTTGADEANCDLLAGRLSTQNARRDQARQA